MLFLSYAYRFLSNFVFLALVYLALNFLEKYQHRVVVAVLVLVYAGMHAASALRSFHFFQRIERIMLKKPSQETRIYVSSTVADRSLAHVSRLNTGHLVLARPSTRPRRGAWPWRLPRDRMPQPRASRSSVMSLLSAMPAR